MQYDQNAHLPATIPSQPWWTVTLKPQTQMNRPFLKCPLPGILSGVRKPRKAVSLALRSLTDATCPFTPCPCSQEHRRKDGTARERAIAAQVAAVHSFSSHLRSWRWRETMAQAILREFLGAKCRLHQKSFLLKLSR